MLRRRGKYLLVDVGPCEEPAGQASGGPAGVSHSGPSVAVVHLRMTGQLVFRPEPGGRPARFVWELEPATTLHFQDVRRFGRLWALAPEAEPAFFADRGMGPEPFGPQFTPAYLRGALAGRRAPLKSFLMDQRRIAGVGNIYADEALFRARLHPLRAAGSVGPREALRLHAAVLETLQAGIDHEGSSIESFIDPAGQRGQLPGDPERLPAHGRALPGVRHADRACGRRRSRYPLLPTLPAASRRHGAGVAAPPRWGRGAALRQASRLGGAGLVSAPAPAPQSGAAAPASPPAQPRLYVVLTRVPRSTSLPVGSLGTVALERGWYAYVGSAARAREARVARHLSREKPLRWHADYLFMAFPAAQAWLVDGALGECELAAALAALSGAERHPRRFGAGDCRCAGHLVRFARRPLRRDLVAAAHAAGAPAKGAVRGFGRRPASS